MRGIHGILDPRVSLNHLTCDWPQSAKQLLRPHRPDGEGCRRSREAGIA